MRERWREPWNHEELGVFEYEEDGWKRRVDIPAFMAFRFAREFDHDPHCELAFEADPDELPTPAAIAVARRLLANQDKLVDNIKELLWDDFHGRGPSSEIWWHGNLDGVNQLLTAEFERPIQLQQQDDLLDIMVPRVIDVRKWVWGYDRPIAEIHFFAAFEMEHGIGILTDGDVLLGIGCSGDARLFDAES